MKMGKLLYNFNRGDVMKKRTAIGTTFALLIGSISMTETYAAPSSKCDSLPTTGVVFRIGRVNSIYETVMDQYNQKVTITGSGSVNKDKTLGSQWIVTFKAPYSAAEVQNSDIESKRLQLAKKCVDYGQQAYATYKQITIAGTTVEWRAGEGDVCSGIIVSDSITAPPTGCGIANPEIAEVPPPVVIPGGNGGDPGAAGN